VDVLVHALPAVPIVTVNGAAAQIGRSFQATNQAIFRLAEARIPKQVNGGRRHRAFEAGDLIRARRIRKFGSKAKPARCRPVHLCWPRWS
jgi:hypothetical protein